MFVATFIHEDWTMIVDSINDKITVGKKGFDEVRTYAIPEGIVGVSQTPEHPEYVRIDTPEESAKYYVFKFEVDNFLVGDIWLEGDEEDAHFDNFASYVFGEDN